MKPIKENQLSELFPDHPGEFNSIDGPLGWRFKSTPGHGFLCVPRHVVQKMPAYMRSTNFSRSGRYEEDCDWCLPVVANLDLFTEHIRLQALKTFYNWHPESFRKLFKRDPVESYYYHRLEAQQVKKETV